MNGIFFDSRPAAPAGLTPTPGAAGSKTITAAWTAFLGAAKYTVSRAASSGGTYTAIGTLATASFADTDIVTGTTYYYAVSDSSTGAASAVSGPVSAKAP